MLVRIFDFDLTLTQKSVQLFAMREANAPLAIGASIAKGQANAKINFRQSLRDVLILNDEEAIAIVSRMNNPDFIGGFLSEVLDGKLIVSDKIHFHYSHPEILFKKFYIEGKKHPIYVSFINKKGACYEEALAHKDSYLEDIKLLEALYRREAKLSNAPLIAFHSSSAKEIEKVQSLPISCVSHSCEKVLPEWDKDLENEDTEVTIDGEQIIHQYLQTFPAKTQDLSLLGAENLAYGKFFKPMQKGEILAFRLAATDAFLTRQKLIYQKGMSASLAQELAHATSKKIIFRDATANVWIAIPPSEDSDEASLTALADCIIDNPASFGSSASIFCMLNATSAVVHPQTFAYYNIRKTGHVFPGRLSPSFIEKTLEKSPSASICCENEIGSGHFLLYFKKSEKILCLDLHASVEREPESFLTPSQSMDYMRRYGTPIKSDKVFLPFMAPMSIPFLLIPSPRYGESPTNFNHSPTP